MSAAEVAQPVAEPAAPVTENTVVEPAAAPTEAATEAPATEAAAPAATETTDAAAAVEAPQEQAKEEAAPVTEGTLGYKGPGLVKSFRFTKRFFYFSDDAVDAKNLTSYLVSEKSSSVAQHTAAWATQTGKGLLFLTKRAEDKAIPAGIFNLSEVSDIIKEGANEFSFKTHGHKHVFQAGSTAERDGWVSALNAKSTEAAAEKTAITESEGFKAELEKITKPAVAAAVVKAAPAPEQDAKETDAAAATPAEDKKEEKKEDKKSRSQSRKRGSIFGSILGGKKEKEEVKEETPVATDATAAHDATPAVAETTETPAETSEAPAAAAATEEATPAAEPTEEKKEETKPVTKTKRASIFGDFFKKVASPSKEKTEEEVAPVANTAPQLQNPVDETAVKPIEPQSVTEAPAVEAAAAAAPEAAATEPVAEDKKEATTPEKRRTSLFSTLGKKTKTESTSDGEGKKTNKLGGLFRKPSKAVKSEDDKKKEATPTEPIAEAEDKPEPIAKDTPVEETAVSADEKPQEPAVAAEPVNVATSSAPVQAAA